MKQLRKEIIDLIEEVGYSCHDQTPPDVLADKILEHINSKYLIVHKCLNGHSVFDFVLCWRCDAEMKILK